MTATPLTHTIQRTGLHGSVGTGCPPYDSRYGYSFMALTTANWSFQAIFGLSQQ